MHDALGRGKARLLQGDDDLLGGLETLLRRLLDAAPDDRVEGRRDVPPRRGELGRRLVQDRGHRVRGRVLLERPPARQQLVEDRPEREDVRAVIDGVAPHLLGGHVARRSHDGAGLGEIRDRHPAVSSGRHAGALGQAEVEDLDVVIRQDEHVVGFQVPMDDALLVRRGDPLGDLERIAEGLTLGNRRRGRAWRAGSRPPAAR